MTGKISSELIPSLLSLFKDKSDASVKAPIVLAILLGDDEELQSKVALETDALKLLADILDNPGELYPEQRKEGALSCIAAIGSVREECRKAIIESKSIVSHMVNSMKNGRNETKLIACQCARVLSRSVKALRTILIDSGIAAPLLELFTSGNVELQTSSCAVLCNLVLEFSPMRKMIIENNVLSILSRMIASSDHSLKINALWTLKNLSYQSDSQTKQEILKNFDYKSIIRFES